VKARCSTLSATVCEKGANFDKRGLQIAD